MRNLLMSVVEIMAVSVFLLPAAAQPNSSSLSSERAQVYADFIDSFSRTSFKLLSNRTFPLDLSVVANDAVCLQGVHLEATGKSAEAAHSLGPEVLRNHSIRIISEQDELTALKQRDKTRASGTADSDGDGSGTPRDPGILALSEITFDTTHHFAVIKYVFLCGPHCNSGAILVLEKVGNRWSARRRPCDGSAFVNGENPRS
jgi:hypothetical protein